MKTLTTSLTVDVAIARLQEGIVATNMRQVSHINNQANAKLLGLTVPTDQILEVFRPDFAIKVWNACKSVVHDISLTDSRL